MRFFLSSCLLFIVCGIGFAQGVSKSTCYAEKLLMQQTSPEFRQLQEEKIQKFIAANRRQIATKRTSAIITIPVVVHVVYNPTQNGSNLSEELIHSQINVLNEDFRRQNNDTTNIPDIFKPLGADIEIEFCLANIDPDGNPTNGITRTASLLNYNPDTFNDYVKHSTTGGADAWPADQYLNIWTCDMSLVVSQYVIGYAQFPGGDPSTDGVVIAWPYFGKTLSASTFPNNLGRTTVHEVGHWLGLRHIWGDGDCTATDFVDDTPKANGAHQSDCATQANTCSNEDPYWAGVDPPDMVENYMDYSGDNCMNLFTKGQKERMMSFLYTDTLRSALFTSDKCSGSSTGINTVSVPEASVSPNPAKESIQLTSNVSLTSIQVRQIDGKLVAELVDIHQSTVTISLTNLTKGLYLINYQTKEGKAGVIRFIKD